ncbi:hypothetical protein AQS8620_01340 [Aquimixticola soesokkakensis]|uniref:DNA repair protein MmcB-related protein n=1 Tax=Aquimixticola soesokkakensis TaxID=1519096 RepID=A0A1Y5SC52_9RHOB|nr:MmcB family DNA repair protein [Aquimixticola soesokkakensis]SLN37032.1 hypothetical protein AQS8620_01340 [Aquimixticola soesokkakensis]
MADSRDFSDDSFFATTQPGQRLARGVCRALRGYDFACVEELVPARGLRVDVMALGPKGEIWIIECKSSRADFMSDSKWQNYLPWCDRFFWAVDADFPTELLPEDTGLIIADAFHAEILRMGPSAKLAGARRSATTRLFARTAARRLSAFRDPRVSDVLTGRAGASD